MQRSLRFLLSGAVFASLASCGSGDAPDAPAPAPATSVPKAAVAPGKGSANASAKRDARRTRSRAGRGYIVQLREPAVAAYAGGINGFAATRAASGSKLDARNPAVVSYRAHLKARQDALLASVAGARRLHSYAYAFNGFAAELTESQAAKLAATPGVLAVTKDVLRQPTTSTTPAFLGLSGPDGFWRENRAKGENIVIGVIDTGIWPELDSFADRNRRPHGPRHGGPGQGADDWAYTPVRGWQGTCVAGEQFDPAVHCNDKLIGARFFNQGFGGDEGVREQFAYEILSPRDAQGHGTHTASTAGGNAGVQVTPDLAPYGAISGIAPRARIAMYKVCWGFEEDGGGCSSSDSMAAIDQAVEDGVDVINFSIGGTADNFLDPVEQAFLRAAEAGIFVAASAGNDGPAAGTVAHPSPWITTVAAGTHNRALKATVTLGNGTVLSGASAALQPLPAAPLINAADAALPGADPALVALCYPATANAGSPVLDPARVAGKIVVCDRGVIDRVAKSAAVKAAGGVGMVLVNVTDGSLNADAHAVPTVHLQVADGRTVRAYAAATTGATAALSQAAAALTEPAPFVAAFSSRGPTPAASGHLLKPDILAPGQDVLAGVSPPGNGGALFALYSGTSMAAPHVAGLAALLKEVHPRWSPMAIKSALMTTAGDALDGANTLPGVLFGQGAGHVQPSNAADPGLVFDSDITDWLGFLCGTQLEESVCTEQRIKVLQPMDVNTPSIALAAVTGTQTVTRRVTNVDSGFATYTAAVTGLEGFDVRIRPRVLTLAPGQTRSFTVSVTPTTAALGQYVGGHVTLTGGTSRKASRQHKVRVPVVLQPVALVAPAEVNTTSYAVSFGYTGAFTATAVGLVPSEATTANVITDGQVAVPLTIAAGTKRLRLSLFDAQTRPASDLDLVLVDSSGEVVASSGSATSEEEIDLVDPAPGDYLAVVLGFSVPGDAGADFTLHRWSLGPQATGNLTVRAPASAVQGAGGTITLNVRNLVPGTKYLGQVEYGGFGGGALPPTVIRLDP